MSDKESKLPPSWTHNPFQAPAAHVADVRQGSGGDLRDEPAAVDAGRGTAWWSEGWEMFREAPGLWVGITLVLGVASIALSMIPLVNILVYVLYPVIGGGLMFGCRSLAAGEGLSFNHAFAGFQRQFAQLAVVGVAYLVSIVVIAVIVGLLFFGGVAFMFGFGDAGAGTGVMTMMLGVLVGLALFVPVAMATWFAPALVILNEQGAVDAMKLSFLGCLKNIVPFLIYGVVGMVLGFVAAIPLGLGLLVLVPVMIASTYIAYRDIYLG